MKLLITGSGGMVGQNILEHHLASDHEILTPNRAELNLLDAPMVKRYLSENKPDMRPLHENHLKNAKYSDMQSP